MLSSQRFSLPLQLKSPPRLLQPQSSSAAAVTSPAVTVTSPAAAAVASSAAVLVTPADSPSINYMPSAEIATMKDSTSIVTPEKKRFRFTAPLDLLMLKAVPKCGAHAAGQNEKQKLMEKAVDIFVTTLPACDCNKKLYS